MNIRRIYRSFLGAMLGGAVCLGTVTVADAADKVRWKMGSFFPSKLIQLGSLGKSLVGKVDRASGGTLKIQFTEPGALIPPKECFDAVSAGSVDACWSTPGYWYGRDPAFAMFSAVPFGPSAGEYMAWYYYGGGKKLFEALYAPHGIHTVLCGVIAPEGSGWFRKEMKTLADLKGLKMRFFGLGAKVMQKIGVSTQLIAGADIYPALERGTIDAAEFSMPAIDLDWGFYQVAKHAYFPGWHQQSTFFDIMINQKKWDALTKQHKTIVEMACGDNMREGLAEGEAIQGKALRTLIGKGVIIHKWTPEILNALKAAWLEVVEEDKAKSDNFKKVWKSYSDFRKEYKIWADLGYLK
jgi:TRAP-type mannitol/chloroaromatic compound transport system substrate-binding protein